MVEPKPVGFLPYPPLTVPKMLFTPFSLPNAPPPAMVAPATPAPLTTLPLKPAITLGVNPKVVSVAGSMRNARWLLTRNSRFAPSVVARTHVQGVVVQPGPVLPPSCQARGDTGRLRK